MLEVSKISHSFTAGNKILDDLSVNVSAGEIVALLGPSGCGKATLLRLIAGLIPVQTGKVTLTQSGGFSFVFQEPSLMPWATVAENIRLPLTLKKEPFLERQEEVMRNLAINDLGDRYPSEISGGQKMRVSIARALIAQPKVLLLDEPFAALDETLRFKMNDLILNLRDNEGVATLFVTHSIYEAAYLADRVMIMENGRITGSVIPDLDRSASPEDQRSSAAFTIASRKISSILAGDGA